MPYRAVSSLSRLNKTILAHYSRFNKIATLGYIMAHEGMGTDHYSMSRLTMRRSHSSTGYCYTREVRLHLRDDRNRIGIVELVYFPEVAVVVNDNHIACITNAEQIIADLYSPGSVRDIMGHQCSSLLTGLVTVA